MPADWGGETGDGGLGLPGGREDLAGRTGWPGGPGPEAPARRPDHQPSRESLQPVPRCGARHQALAGEEACGGSLPGIENHDLNFNCRDRPKIEITSRAYQI